MKSVEAVGTQHNRIPAKEQVSPMVETLDGDIAMDTEIFLCTDFAYINENSLKNCLQLSDSL